MSRQALSREKACSRVTGFGKVTRKAPPEGSVGQHASLRASSGQREVCVLGQQGGSSCFRGRGMSLCLLPGFDGHWGGGEVWADEWPGAESMSLGSRQGRQAREHYKALGER